MKPALGYAGVDGSFLLFTKRVEKKYTLPARDILVKMSRRGLVGGQEDMIEATVMTMARECGLLTIASIESTNENNSHLSG